jgi:hypothetical protein
MDGSMTKRLSMSMPIVFSPYEHLFITINEQGP